MATSGQKRNHHRYAVGKIDRTAAAIRQSRMPTIAFCWNSSPDLSWTNALTRTLFCRPSIHRICRTFYSTTRMVTILASMPHAPILEVRVSIATFAAWPVRLSPPSIWYGQRLAGACISQKKSPSTQSSPSMVPTIAFFLFCWWGGVRPDWVMTFRLADFLG